MKNQVSKSDFIREFETFDRVSNFGRDGLDALFDYLEQLEDGTGEEIELDVIALCCDFNRYESIEEYNESYGTDWDAMEQVEAFACRIDNDAFVTYTH